MSNENIDQEICMHKRSIATKTIEDNLEKISNYVSSMHNRKLRSPPLLLLAGVYLLLRMMR